jgi:hypothetical protein
VQHAVDAKAHEAHVAPRLDVDVGGALLERVLPQPVDDVDDVRVVGVEVAVAAELDQLLEVAQREVALGRLPARASSTGEVEELAHVPPDVLRVAEDELHLPLDHLRRSSAHARTNGSLVATVTSAVDRDRQDAEALGVRVRHRLRHGRRSIFSGSMW